MANSKLERFRNSLRTGWSKNRRKTLRRLSSWLEPIDEAPSGKLYFAKSFLEKHADQEEHPKLQKLILSEIEKRDARKINICEDEESCVFNLIGNIKHFLKNKNNFHHPNKKGLVKQANSLLDDCFECKRSIYEARERVGTEEEIKEAVEMIDKQVELLQSRMKPIADEVSEYTSELERLAYILRKY